MSKQIDLYIHFESIFNWKEKFEIKKYEYLSELIKGDNVKNVYFLSCKANKVGGASNEDVYFQEKFIFSEMPITSYRKNTYTQTYCDVIKFLDKFPNLDKIKDYTYKNVEGKFCYKKEESYLFISQNISPLALVGEQERALFKAHKYMKKYLIKDNWKSFITGRQAETYSNLELYTILNLYNNVWVSPKSNEKDKDFVFANNFLKHQFILDKNLFDKLNTKLIKQQINDILKSK